ncbi:MAG: ABC transporter ATP-binding protein [Clostridia bacterium]|nr:ABC transporter ATP-binding protein [Clostridia bacterium]
MNTILNIEKISLSYHTKQGEIKALNSISFDVSDGEFIAIVGPSGCGKTSILSIIAGLIKPSGGKVLLFGNEIEKPTESIGYMLQKDQLFPWRTIEKNTLLPLEIHGLKKDEDKRKNVELLLKKYGLWEFRKSYPNQLSGGMRQRVALIRTLASSPKLLLLDEPFSALDYQTRLSVCDDVYDIIKREKKTAILVTHDISEAIALADRIIVLTKRPSNILNIHYIDTDKSVSPLKRRESKDFSSWFERLWRELNYEKA